MIVLDSYLLFWATLYVPT